MNVQNIKNTIGEGVERVAETAADIAGSTGIGVATAGEVVKPHVSNVGNTVGTVAGTAGTVVGKVAEKVGTTAVGGARVAHRAVDTVGGAATTATATLAHKVGQFGLGLARDVKVARTKAVREARDVARSAAVQEREARAAAKKAEAQIARAMAEKEREVRAVQLAHRTTKASESKVVKALEVQTTKRLAEHEKALHDLERQLARMTKRRRRGGNNLLPLLAVVGGGYYLARNPVIRHRILDRVRGVSPQAADFLHSAGRQARAIVGEVWIEHEEEPQAASQTSGTTPGQATGAAKAPTPTSR